MYYNSDIIEMKKGDTIIVNSENLHYVAPEDDMHLYCLIVDKAFFEENEIDVSSLEFDKIIKDPEAAKLMCDVQDAIENGTGEFEMAKKRQTVLTYILYLCQNYSRKKLNAYTPESKAYLAVREAIKYVDENISKKIVLEDLAERFNYSKYHFARLFKQCTSYTLVEHIRRKRVNLAYRMLCDTENKKTLTQICDECGFTSYAYFSKCFKAEYGEFPSHYRKNNVGK